MSNIVTAHDFMRRKLVTLHPSDKVLVGVERL